MRALALDLWRRLVKDPWPKDDKVDSYKFAHRFAQVYYNIKPIDERKEKDFKSSYVKVWWHYFDQAAPPNENRLSVNEEVQVARPREQDRACWDCQP